MQRIGALIPVTAGQLVCAAMQTFDADFMRRGVLLDRMQDMRDLLTDVNARVLRADSSVEETFDRAYRMLRMRRVLVEGRRRIRDPPAGARLVSYYANSIAHLLGPFAAGIRARDALALSMDLGA